MQLIPKLTCAEVADQENGLRRVTLRLPTTRTPRSSRRSPTTGRSAG
jgi:hypothetical protein